jgi:DNA (cytosine-5)-methyltransferase 1
MTVYYNEIDPYAAQWLRNLIAAGHLAKGEVDERSITEIQPDDLLGFDQCHFFAGIGVWGHALRRAGWADDRPVWTGSCPCQPFSAAGKQEGFADERHLWPTWFNLIRQCRPAIVLGEQVASALDWLDLVSTDMESAGYAFGAADLCAAGFGGAHIRQRLYFAGLANAPLDGRRQGVEDGGRLRSGNREEGTAGRSAINSDLSGGLADADHQRQRSPTISRLCNEEYYAEPRSSVSGLADAEHHDGRAVQQKRRPEGRTADGWDCAGAGGNGGDERIGLADTKCEGLERRRGSKCDQFNSDGQTYSRRRADERGSAPMLGRNAADWLYCRDDKWRPVEPGTFPLADAAASRVGRLRAYGNGLDAETATQFVAAVMDCAP